MPGSPKPNGPKKTGRQPPHSFSHVSQFRQQQRKYAKRQKKEQRFAEHHARIPLPPAIANRLANALADPRISPGDKKKLPRLAHTAFEILESPIANQIERLQLVDAHNRRLILNHLLPEETGIPLLEHFAK